MSGIDNQQRQKRIAIGGGIVLVALVALQGPKLLGGSSVPSAAPAVVTEQDSTATSRPGQTDIPARRLRSLARRSRFQLKDPFVPRLGDRATLTASAGTASSAGPSLLSPSGRSYDESVSLAASPGPSMLSGASAVSQPVEPTADPPEENSGGGTDERYTVILSSISISAGRGAAERDVRRFRKAGLRKVGVLLSSRYRSLRAGYYVVYSGSYASSAAARRAAAQARAHARSAHPLRLRLSNAGL